MGSNWEQRMVVDSPLVPLSTTSVPNMSTLKACNARTELRQLPVRPAFRTLSTGARVKSLSVRWSEHGFSRVFTNHPDGIRWLPVMLPANASFSLQCRMPSDKKPVQMTQARYQYREGCSHLTKIWCEPSRGKRANWPMRL